MRDGFREIASGWMLVDDFDFITERIEALAAWTKLNGPLEADEEATVRVMIERQVVLGLEATPGEVLNGRL